MVKGWNWFPANQIVLWAVMSWAAGREHPRWSRGKSIATGALTMTIILGSEWLHNLAHAAAARWIGKPADALRIFMGMPLMVYRDENNSSVTPREHILRALGGPAFNACLLALAVDLEAVYAARFGGPGSRGRGGRDEHPLIHPVTAAHPRH